MIRLLLQQLAAAAGARAAATVVRRGCGTSRSQVKPTSREIRVDLEIALISAASNRRDCCAALSLGICLRSSNTSRSRNSSSRQQQLESPVSSLQLLFKSSCPSINLRLQTFCQVGAGIPWGSLCTLGSKTGAAVVTAAAIALAAAAADDDPSLATTVKTMRKRRFTY